MKILIKDISLLDVLNREIRECVNIGIEGDKIVFVGEVLENFAPEKTIDGENRIAIPGLSNSHTHIPMSILRNYGDDLPLWEWLNDKIWPAEKHLTPEDVYWGAMLSLGEMISSGVTSFVDMYFHIDSIGEALSDSKTRGFVSRGLIGQDDSSGEQLAEAEDFIKNWHNTENGRIKSMVAPHAIYTCPENYIKKTMALAEKYGQRIHIHLSESEKEVRESLRDYGMSPVEYVSGLGLLDLPTVAAHCVHLSERDMVILKEKKVNVVNNPSSNLKLGNGFAKIDEMLKMGINVAIGTDGSASNNNLNMFEEMHLAALVNKGVNKDPLSVPAIEILSMATVNGAVAMGMEKELGSIEVGKKADIAIVNLDSAHLCPRNNLVSALVYSAQSSDVETVIVDGNILLENREHKTIDMEKAKYMVGNISSRLRRK